MAPARTPVPVPVIARLSRDMVAAGRHPEVIKAVELAAGLMAIGSAEDMARFLVAENRLWGLAVRDAGIAPE